MSGNQYLGHSSFLHQDISKITTEIKVWYMIVVHFKYIFQEIQELNCGLWKFPRFEPIWRYSRNFISGGNSEKFPLFITCSVLITFYWLVRSTVTCLTDNGEFSCKKQHWSVCETYTPIRVPQYEPKIQQMTLVLNSGYIIGNSLV